MYSTIIFKCWKLTSTKLHHVENEEYSISHLHSPTCTCLDNLKSRKKIQFKKKVLECILDMWLINIIVIKLKIILMLIIKYIFLTFKEYDKTCLWLFFLWQGTKIVYCTTTCEHQNKTYLWNLWFETLFKNHNKFVAQKNRKGRDFQTTWKIDDKIEWTQVRKWKKINDEYWKVVKEVDMKCKHIDNDELREHGSMKIVRRQKMIKNYA